MTGCSRCDEFEGRIDELAHLARSDPEIDVTTTIEFLRMLYREHVTFEITATVANLAERR